MRAEHETFLQTSNQLRFRIAELESNVTSYDSVTNKSSLAITVLQRDAKEKQDQLVELEGRARYCSADESVDACIESRLPFRIHLQAREESERKIELFEKKLQELFGQMGVTLTGDFGQPSTSSFDALMAKVRERRAGNQPPSPYASP